MVRTACTLYCKQWETAVDGWPELTLMLLPWFGSPWANVLVITVAAAGAHFALRRQFTALAAVAWTLAWAVLFSTETIMHHPPYSLMKSATGAALGVTVGVVTAVLVVPWREQPALDWHWARVVWWLGRGVFGVGIACLLMYALIFVVYLGG